MKRHDRSGVVPDGADRGPTNASGPGKRALTDRLRVQRKAAQGPSVLPQRQDHAGSDPSSESMESRTTVDGAPTSSRLTDAQHRKACERNPRWQSKLGFSTSLFGGGDVATREFAENVAGRQAALGLEVDGIAGPDTVNAVTGAGSGATVPDDPFGLHLLAAASRPGTDAADRRGRRRAGGRGPTGAAAEQRLRCDVTDLQPKEDGVQLVIGAGASDGVDESWHVHLLGSELRWTISEVRQNATVVISRRGTIDDVRGLEVADLRGRPRAEDLPEPPTAEATTVAAATEAEVPWWTLED